VEDWSTRNMWGFSRAVLFFSCRCLQPCHCGFPKVSLINFFFIVLHNYLFTCLILLILLLWFCIFLSTTCCLRRLTKRRRNGYVGAPFRLVFYDCVFHYLKCAHLFGLIFSRLTHSFFNELFMTLLINAFA